MFWEKADFDDTDAHAAFRKRIKEKMKLRKKPKMEYDGLKKMYEVRDQSIKVLRILQLMWGREERKKRLNLAELKTQELLLEISSKDKNSVGKQNYTKADLDRFVPRRVEEHSRITVKESRVKTPKPEREFSFE